MRTLHVHRFSAMAGPCALHFYSDGDAAAIAAAAEQEVRRIQDKYSRFQPDSVISQINACAPGSSAELDPETCSLLDFADAAYAQSQGLFDISAGVLRRAWDFRAAKIPSSSDIAKLLPLIGWHQMRWQAPLLSLPRDRMEIDFGGFGKEYAADCAARCLRQAGVQHGLVDLSGDICVLGPHPDGQPWQVGIQHPRAAQAIAQLPISAGAVASSGDYERSFIVNGQRYHHILDPRTGWPSQGLSAVSVMAEQCIVAGMASTTAMLMGPSAGLDWLRALGLPFLAVDEALRIHRHDDPQATQKKPAGEAPRA